MSSTLYLPQRRRQRQYRLVEKGAAAVQPAIDSCICHSWARDEDVITYLERGWREFLGRSSVDGGALPFLPRVPYERLGRGKRDDAYQPPDQLPGSDYTMLKRDILGDESISAVILSFDKAFLAPVIPNHYFGLEIIKAINRWSVEEWLSHEDERLFGLLLVPTQLPAEAAEEIRRYADHPRVVGLLMGGNGMGKAFGHPVYHPIYEAANEFDLPVVIRSGGDALPNTTTQPTAGGPPSLFTEYSALTAQPLMTHLASVLFQGVLEKHPRVRFLLVGGGVAWLPGFLWRIDENYKALGTREAPWLTRLPSEYARESVRVCTYPLEKVPADEPLIRFLRAYPGMEDILCFGSGYPNWDSDRPTDIAARLPEDWVPKVLHDNAKEFFRWSHPVRSKPNGAMGRDKATTR